MRDKIERAHKAAAGAAGQLSLALEAGRISRKLLDDLIADLDAALKALKNVKTN